MATKDDIVNLYLDRRKARAPLMAAREYIRAIYKGDVEIPLPDQDRYEKAYVPNLLQSGLDQMAGRVASTVPQCEFTALGDNRRAVRAADTRRKVVQGWWAEDHLPIKWKYRARHLLAYAASPVQVYYDSKEQRPCWRVRDPFTAFPAYDAEPGHVTPSDMLYAYKRTVGWLRSQGYDLTGLVGADAKRDDTVTLLEYCDPNQRALVAYTEPVDRDIAWTTVDARRSIYLMNEPNPIGEVTSTYPTRIALEDSGQFDGMVGAYLMQAKLMALEIIAVEKGIFPDTYLEGRAGEVPRFVSGPHDGRTGEVNVVAGGTIKSMNEQPGYVTTGIIDRLERAQRITSGVPAEFGGESGTNIRTGRRGDAVLSAVIDFPVAEAQEMLALALQEEDEVAIALSRYYDGLSPRTIYVGTGNSRTAVTYVAANVFPEEATDHSVTYPITGTDLNSFMIGVGQRVGLGTMSKKTAAALDPVIADSEAEHDEIIAEGLETALLSGLQQQAASGAIPPAVLSKIMTLVSTDRLELPEAITKATEEYAAEQAAQQAQAQAGMPGMPPTADAAAAGAGVASLAGQSPIPGATPGQTDLASLLSTLRAPTNTQMPMRRASQGAM